MKESTWLPENKSKYRLDNILSFLLGGLGQFFHYSLGHSDQFFQRDKRFNAFEFVYISYTM